MDLNLYQWVVPILGLLLIARSIYHFVKGRQGLFMLILWILTGISIGLLAVFPDAISFPIANWLGIKSNVNAVIFIGLGGLLINNYLLSQKLQRQNEQIKTLARKYALENPQIPDSK